MLFQPNDKIAYVEFGSGRGQLTYWVARATDRNGLNSNGNESSFQNLSMDAKFILIDKASHRHKFDNKLKDETPQLNTTRIRVDIEDVVLSNIDDLCGRVSNSNLLEISVPIMPPLRYTRFINITCQFLESGGYQQAFMWSSYRFGNKFLSKFWCHFSITD